MIASMVEDAGVAIIAKKQALSFLCNMFPMEKDMRMLSYNSSRACDGNGLRRTISYIL
jgi:hypothetical protein